MDLHGLHVEEAIEYIDERVDTLRAKGAAPRLCFLTE
jgi:hypothetical protein